jgi:NAD+ synthase
MKEIKIAKMNPEFVCKQIGDFVINQVTKINSTGCVIGLSGGVDSTTTSAVIKKAFDNYNTTHDKKLELVAYLLPSKINNPGDTKDGESVANILGLRYEVLSLDKIVDAFQTTNPESFKTNYDKGNMISRIRGNVLSTKAATEKKIVAGTGNKDEDFGVGYYTLFGDGAVHISPIGNLSKRLVRELASYLGFDKKFVYREPTAGLETGQTDFKDLGYRYETVELLMEGIAQGFTIDELYKHPQVISMLEKQFAEYQTIFKTQKFATIEDAVNDVFRRNQIALSKAEIIHPPIAPVTLIYN